MRGLGWSHPGTYFCICRETLAPTVNNANNFSSSVTIPASNPTVLSPDLTQGTFSRTL